MSECFALFQQVQKPFHWNYLLHSNSCLHRKRFDWDDVTANDSLFSHILKLYRLGCNTAKFVKSYSADAGIFPAILCKSI